MDLPTLSDLVPEKMLSQAGLSADQNAIGYPGTKETWILHTKTGTLIGYLSLHQSEEIEPVISLQFSRVLPQQTSGIVRCYIHCITAGHGSIRQFIRQLANSANDPYLDPNIVDPAPEVWDR